MRILLFSDHHAHAWRAYSRLGPDGMLDRLRDGLNVLDQIGQLAKKERVDAIMFAGDLFHQRGIITVQTWNATYDAIAKLSLVAPVTLLVGNHDQNQRDGEVHSIYALGTVATVLDRPGFVTLASRTGEEVNVLAVPYQRDAELLATTIRTELAGYQPGLLPSLMLAHLSVSGAQVGTNFVLEDEALLQLSDLLTPKLDQVFLGHYHEPQELAPTVRYLGATHHHNWGDVGSRRGCWLWDTAERQPYSQPTLIPLQAPEFKQIPYGRITPHEHGGHFIRMLVPAGESLTAVAAMEREAVACGVRSIELIPLEAAAATPSTAAFHPGMDLVTMVDRYVAEMEPADLDQDRLIQLGRDLLGHGEVTDA